MGNYIVGLDIGGTNIRIGASKDGGELERFTCVSRESVLGGANNALKLAQFIADYQRKMLSNNTVDAVCVGFPSTLSRDRRTILQTPNIENLDNINMADTLEDGLKTRVFLEKDVNLLFMNDRRVLGLTDDGIDVGIYFGTGIGNAVYFNGMPLIGKDGVAGEIGHIAMVGGKSICGCGNEGCAECYASGRRLKHIKERYFPDTEIGKIFFGNEESPVLREFINAVACVIATEVNILNPDSVVLGGGVVNMMGFPKKLLWECVQKHSRKPYPAETLVLNYATDSVESGVKGAILYAQKKLDAFV